jgi:hypothetical protein
MTYCVVADLQKYVSTIDSYDLKVELADFEFQSLGSDVFQLDDSGSVIIAYRNGVDLGAAAANVGAVSSDGDWFYDAALDRFTIKLGASDSPTDADIRLQRAPETWADAKTYAVQLGQSKVEQELDERFPRPLPKVADNPTGDDYDQAVVELNALYACVHLIKSSGSDDWLAVQNRIFNEQETGILDRLNAGEIKLSFELTRSDDGQIKAISLDAATTGDLVDAIGTPSTDYEVYLITIGTGGTLTAGTENTTIDYTVTDSQGSEVQGATIITGLFQAMGGGMSARFTSSADGLVYTAADKWSLTVQTEGVDTSVVGTITMTRL